MNVITQFPAALDYDPDLRFRAMFEGAAIGIGICQLAGRILEANPALSEMLGYRQQELTGTHHGDFFPAAPPELHRETGREIYPTGFLPDEQLLGELLRGERDSFEIEKKRQEYLAGGRPPGGAQVHAARLAGSRLPDFRCLQREGSAESFRGALRRCRSADRRLHDAGNEWAGTRGNIAPAEAGAESPVGLRL